MKNQITSSLKSISLALLMLFMAGSSALAQNPGPNPGPGHPGPGPIPPVPGNHHPRACNAHFVHHRDSVVNGINFINVPGSGAATYAWDFGDGSSSSSSSPNHVYASPGTYWVCLTITDTVQGGCSNTWCDSVRVFTPPPHCNARFHARRDTVANGLRFRAALNSPGATYDWDFGDGSTGSGPAPTHTYSAQGVYYVCLTVNNTNAGGSCTDTFCDSVRVFTPAPHCNAHFFAGRDSVANNVRFRSARNAPGSTYDWDFGDGSTSTDPNPNHAYAAAGTYYVCLIVTTNNAGGSCSDTFCDSVNTDSLHGHPHHPMPPTHTHKIANPNGAMATDEAYVSVYPNPLVSSSTIHVENAIGNVVFRLYQMNGQVIMTKEIGNGDFQLNKENLSEGIYFYSVEDNGENIAKGKLRVY